MNRSWAFLIVTVVVLLVYLPSLPGDFHFDDYLLLLDNPDVNAPTFRYASFLDHYGGRPLTLLSFHWNYELAGREPLSYVACNIALHLLACLLLLGTIQAITNRFYLALGSTLIFALHPLQTQAVNYIWSRSMLLMACFTLAALWTANRRKQWWSLILLQLAIWSRTEAMAITPFLLAQGVRPASLVILLGLNAVGFLTGLIRFAPVETGWLHSDKIGFWLAQPAVIQKYLTMMIWPVGLSIDHDYQPSGPLLVTSFLLLAGLIFLAYRLRGRDRMISWGALWILLFLAPASLIPNQDLFNESRSYLALAGFAFLVSLLLFDNQSTLGPRTTNLALGVLLLSMISLTVPRNRAWNDNLRLWSEAAERYPLKLRIQYNLGHARILEGQISSAEEAFGEALRLNPKDDLSYAALGYCAETKGDWLTARSYYQRAVTLNQKNGYALDGLERAERELGSTPLPGGYEERP